MELVASWPKLRRLLKFCSAVGAGALTCFLLLHLIDVVSPLGHIYSLIFRYMFPYAAGFAIIVVVLEDGDAWFEKILQRSRRLSQPESNHS